MAKGLVDSNILIYAHDKTSKFHSQAKSWLEDKVEEGEVVISWQNLLEFYSIVTSSKRVKRALSPEIGRVLLKYLSEAIEIISPNRKSEKTFLQVLSKSKFVGPSVYDAYLASVVLGNGFKVVYTLNTKDFSNISAIEAVNPLTE